MAIRCPECNCPRCPTVRTEERRISFRGRLRILQRRYRKCEHCDNGFWSREFIEDKKNIGEHSPVNPLFTRDFIENQADNPYIQGSET
jgi:hypothetical protein